MDEHEINEAIELFLADDKLSELCEILKTGDDILDVISLNETQHSDVLAWLFDPREGHGQGDQILGDLLLAAQRTASQDSGLDGRGRTSRFFEQWPPSRIRTTSFGTAFTARELGMMAAERVDLFVVDPTNKFVLLIENKAGDAHTSEQLDGYRDAWLNTVARYPHLQDFSSVFIALDREFGAEDWSDRPSNGHWLHLGYDWLRASADRALRHVERGNAGARLVVSYCNRQTDWESPASRRAVELAAEFHERHGAAVKELLGSSLVRLEKKWIQNRSNARMMFMLQNKSVMSLLRDTRGMASITEMLARKMQVLHRDSIAHGRTWLNICPPGWEKYEGEYWWPVYINISYADKSKSKYNIDIILDKDFASSEEEGEDLRARLEKVDERFSKHRTTYRRRVVLEKSVVASDLASKLDGWFKILSKAAQDI